VLEANPYYWGGEVKTPNVIFVFVADTNQAVAQLLNGDVDYLDDSTLGAGAEVQTVIDAPRRPATSSTKSPPARPGSTSTSTCSPDKLIRHEDSLRILVSYQQCLDAKRAGLRCAARPFA
jgi:hypothetical protein